MIDLVFFCKKPMNQKNEGENKSLQVKQKMCHYFKEKEKSMQYRILFNLNRPVKVEIGDILYKFPRFKET